MIEKRELEGTGRGGVKKGWGGGGKKGGEGNQPSHRFITKHPHFLYNFLLLTYKVQSIYIYLCSNADFVCPCLQKD